jgi:hypothetical protein
MAAIVTPTPAANTAANLDVPPKVSQICNLFLHEEAVGIEQVVMYTTANKTAIKAVCPTRQDFILVYEPLLRQGCDCVLRPRGRAKGYNTLVRKNRLRMFKRFLTKFMKNMGFEDEEAEDIVADEGDDDGDDEGSVMGTPLIEHAAAGHEGMPELIADDDEEAVDVFAPSPIPLEKRVNNVTVKKDGSITVNVMKTQTALVYPVGHFEVVHNVMFTAKKWSAEKKRKVLEGVAVEDGSLKYRQCLEEKWNLIYMTPEDVHDEMEEHLDDA